MMTRWRWLGVLLCVCCARAGDARWPDGLLNYCGFEGYWDEAGWRDLGWAQGGTPGVRFDHEIKRFGKGAMRIEGAQGETRGALQLDGVAPQPGKRYVLRVWIKTRDIQGEAAVALQPHEEGKPLAFLDLGPKSRLQGTHDWSLVEVEVPRLSKKIVRIYPYLWVKGTGTAWFDEFALTEAGVDVPLGGQKPVTEADYAGVRFDDAALPKNLLVNPSFEDGLSGWFMESGKPTIDGTTAAAGRNSLRCDGFPECSYCAVNLHVRIDPRRAYRLSLKLKTDLHAGLSCVQFLPLGASGQPIAFFGQDHTHEFCYGRGVQDWHEVSVVVRQFPPETDAVHVYLVLQDAVGTVWFDDVRFTPLSLSETHKVQKP
jgi:hypothetical protein